MDLENFLSRFQTVSFKKGAMIFAQDELLKHAYGVKSGIVKVYNITGDGEEKTIAFKLKGDIFSLGWLFGRHDKTLYLYEAYTDCELHLLDKPTFQKAIKNEPVITSALLQYLVNEHLTDGLRFNALEQSRSQQKIVGLLQTMCLRYGSDVKKDVVRITVPLRQQDIANFLGITRETAAVELKKLKKQRVVSYKNCYYTVHTDKLNALLDDEYNPGIEL